jgi:hypothetical protein
MRPLCYLLLLPGGSFYLCFTQFFKAMVISCRRFSKSLRSHLLDYTISNTDSFGLIDSDDCDECERLLRIDIQNYI